MLILTILGITLNAASVAFAFTGPFNTWKASNRPAPTPDTNPPRTRSLQLFGRMGKFLFSAYTLSFVGITYNLWYSIHLVHKQNGVTLHFVVDFTITVALILLQSFLVLLKWTTDLIDKSLNGIVNVLTMQNKLMADISDQVENLIRDQSSSLTVIGGVQENIAILCESQKKMIETVARITELPAKLRRRAQRPKSN